MNWRCAAYVRALAVAFLWLSGVIPLSTYAWPILASATLLPAREECRKKLRMELLCRRGSLRTSSLRGQGIGALFCVLGYYPS